MPAARATPGSRALAASLPVSRWRKESWNAADNGSSRWMPSTAGAARGASPPPGASLDLLEEIHDEARAPDAHDLYAGRLDRQEALVLPLVPAHLEDQVGLGPEHLHGVLHEGKLKALGELAALGAIARVGDDGDGDAGNAAERLDRLDEMDARPDQAHLVRAPGGRWHGSHYTQAPVRLRDVVEHWRRAPERPQARPLRAGAAPTRVGGVVHAGGKRLADQADGGPRPPENPGGGVA